jgi:hypothetical protein
VKVFLPIILWNVIARERIKSKFFRYFQFKKIDWVSFHLFRKKREIIYHFIGNAQQFEKVKTWNFIWYQVIRMEKCNLLKKY